MEGGKEGRWKGREEGKKGEEVVGGRRWREVAGRREGGLVEGSGEMTQKEGGRKVSGGK